MPDEPTDSDATPREPGELPGRSLSEILEELALLSHAQQGEASEMRSAVSELSRALARLFEMIRTDRREAHAKIAQLERELTAAREQLAALGAEPLVPPAPNDFDQLRAAAERLRIRTEQLVREAADVPLAPEEPEAEYEAEVPSDDASVESTAVEPVAEAPVLRIVPETPPAPDLEVESELPLAVAAAEPAAVDESAREAPVAPAADVAVAVPPPAPEVPSAPEEPEVPARPAPPEPIEVGPRPAQPRGLRPRRRRIDARKLRDVEPTAALGSMVGAVQQLWTAGCPLDLVIAFTDGGAVRVSGGDRAPLRVEEVEPGTPARCTITATRRQLIPLFGRLELTDAESAPLIHGSRRDADLLVGWFDRAQRLPVAPL